MDVKPGVKQTEIGDIPEDWEVIPMFRITEQNRPITYGIVQAGPHIENGIPYIRSSDLNTSCIDISTLQRTSNQIAEFYKRSEVYPNDIVFSLRGNIGISKIVPNELKRANLTQGTARISCKKNILNIYVLYALYSSYFRKQIENAQKGSTFKEVSLGMLQSFHILLPPLPEQRTIASALSDADAHISFLEEVIAKKRDIKQVAMHELLTGKRRLPGFDGDMVYKQTDLGWVPEKWLICRLKEGLTLKHGHQFGDFDFVNDGIPVIKISQLGMNGRLDLNNLCYIPFERSEDYNDILIQKEDTLIALTGGTLGKTIWVDRDYGKMVQNYRVGKIVPLNNRFLKSFIYFFVISNVIQNQIFNTINEAAQPNLGKVDFENFWIPIPSLQEQDAIATVLSDMDAEITALEKQRDKTKAIKQGMMQELLTGRIRLV